MATKINKKTQSKRSDNTAYKVVLALVLLCGGLMFLENLGDYCAQIRGIFGLLPKARLIATIGFIACAVFTVVFVLTLTVWKNRICVAVMPWLMFISAMAGITGLSMQKEAFEGFYLLYFLWAFVLVQYIIYQLYHWEFFLFSLPTLTTGFLFFQIKSAYNMNVRFVLPLILAIVSILLVAAVAVMASKNKGCLVFGNTRIRLFSKKYNPFLHYLAVALWGICIPTAFILGGLFTYTCMFAAIAAELIAAVYYTFKLN